MDTGNHFLDSLDPADFEALRPRLRSVKVSAGDILIEQDDAVATVHFPVGAQLANVTLLDSGEMIETSVVGYEGVSGLAPFMADAPCAWRVLVRAAGDALVMRASELRDLYHQSPTLLARLLVLTHYYQAQAVQTATCNAAHRVRPRVARWLLTASDFTPDEEILFTQEEMAAFLGAQRTSVVEAFSVLKRAGILRHARGRCRILDRARLVDEACSCYASMRERAEALRLLPR
jgi:CRP-like cAMP-binding protein